MRFHTHLIRLISTNQIYSRRNHFNLPFNYSLQVIYAAVISLQFMKKIQMYQYLFNDYHLVHIMEKV